MMPGMKSHQKLPCVAVIALMVCTFAAAEAPWPTKDWTSSTPSAQGMEAVKLNAALAAAQVQSLELHSLLVVRHGFLLMEKYFSTFNRTTSTELYSCTKSFISALTGIAIDKGFIADVSQPVLGFFPGAKFDRMDSRKKSMKIDDLLTMTSGLGWVEGDATYRQMYTSSRDWAKFVLDIPMAYQPGQRFNYSSGDSHLLAAILQKKTGTDLYDFARAQLFVPLGIRDPQWERDPAGIPIGGWGLQLTPREMAKLGYLYLHNGSWDGKQIVPASWVQSSTRPHSSPNGELKYGYQWWVSPPGGWYAALGRFGQCIFVVPSLDLVVVFTAHIESNDREADLLVKYIMPACAPG
jgi:CubicO group peptidase (beta-lactamase class C family)